MSEAPDPELPLLSLMPQGKTFLDLSPDEQTALVQSWRKDRIFRVRVKRAKKLKIPAVEME